MRELTPEQVDELARLIAEALEQRNGPPKRPVPKPRPTGKKEEAFTHVSR